MNYSLPKSVEIDGERFSIRYDFRVVLEIIEMLNDDDLSNRDKQVCLLTMFYPEWRNIKNPNEAVRKCFEFIDQGERQNKKGPRLIDWEQDFEYIIAPVNKALGFETRAVEYDPENNTGGVHWWTFLSGFMEMGTDSIMAQIVSIRSKLAKGKKLENYEKEWLRNNRSLVNIKRKYTEQDSEMINKWLKGGDENG